VAAASTRTTRTLGSAAGRLAGPFRLVGKVRRALVASPANRKVMAAITFNPQPAAPPRTQARKLTLVKKPATENPAAASSDLSR